MEKFYIHTIFDNCGNLKIKRGGKVFLFHLGRSQDFDRTGKVDKKRTQTFTRTPQWSPRGENFENCL